MISIHKFHILLNQLTYLTSSFGLFNNEILEECSFNADGEATENRIIFNYDDDLNLTSELNLSGSCVLLEKDEPVVVRHRIAKHRTFKEKSRRDKPKDATMFAVRKSGVRSPSTDSDWEII
ncbi:uncharacterized protein LOC124912919 [Impatiens glandulifera]|uniref:uncharacterized protein LOC124912919 n=1 Tax=Impatiens glandulifera TaxID=253017 RepID=UPI001FB168CF|nr:uncharacterized protein LOC124912919 [Impatiens glandulifera]